MIKSGIILLASRTNSKRLPAKNLLDFWGIPMVLRCVKNLQTSKNFNVAVVTTDRSEDDYLVNLLERFSIDYFRGSSDDLIDRHLKAANQFEADHIIRVTGDCPFVCGEQIDQLVASIDSSSFRLWSTRGKFPIGLDVEIFSTNMLLDLQNKHDLTGDECEHVTLGFYNRGYPVTYFNPPDGLKRMGRKFTVDTFEDYILSLIDYPAIIEEIKAQFRG